MDAPSNNLRTIRPADTDPRFNWGRRLPAQRVNYSRLREYRIGRARSALEASEFGALLVFDVNDIRYLTSTKIGEWARDKPSRWALLVRSGEAILWDFGSAAAHHKLFCPWLKPENVRAGLIGLRGTVHPDFGLMDSHAKEIFGLLKDTGLDRLPVGVDIVDGPARLSGGVSVTPLARRLASDAKIDLSRLKGSGPPGRIVARDVESVRRPHPAPSQAALAEGPTADHVKAPYNPAGYEEVPLDGMRKTIAARLQQAKRTIPHFYLTADITIDALIAVREQVNAAAPKDSDGKPLFKLSLNDCSATHSGGKRGLGGRPHFALHTDVGVAVALDGGFDRADYPSGRNKDAERDLGRDEGFGRARPRQEAEACGVPGRIVGDFQSRHVRRARVLGHHQSAAGHDPRRVRCTPPGHRDGRRRRRLRQHAHRDTVL
jgi:hypothetical protein